MWYEILIGLWILCKVKIKGCFFKEVCFVNKKSNLLKFRDNLL